jgi:hypothetical protein
MELNQHSDRPELTVEIGGVRYDFGEIMIGQRADLEAWIRKNIPHPLDELKGRLEGLPDKVAAAIAENARQEAKDWPPRIGTGAGTAALLSKEEGQVLALHVGLQKFHPGTTAEQAGRLYQQLGRDAVRKRGPNSEGTVKRIFCVMFGMGDPGGNDDPKDQSESEYISDKNGFPGTPYTAGASGN